MAAKRIKWNSLLRYAELEFVPDEQPKLTVSDEIIQSLSWLTGATRQDRRLLRCTQQGALLVADAWSGLNSAETYDLYPQSGTADTFSPSVEHIAILLSTSTQLVKVRFIRKSGGDAEYFYVPPNSYFFFPYRAYAVTAYVVPDPGGTANYVGIVALI